MTEHPANPSLSRHPLLDAALTLTVLTAFLTWPQALFMASKVAGHLDPHFSAWRLAWVAHALRTDPWHLFDANVYYPATGTLTFSDATLLEGVLSAPLFWARVPTPLIYNLMLFAGFLSSGLAMFVLIRYLTRDANAALVGAAIFTLAPYRIEHFMHLELQWTAFMPLAFWAAHRAIDSRSWRHGLLVGVFLWLQFLACVYYGIFLGLILAVLCPLLLAADPKAARGALPGLVGGALLALALSWPYARMYLHSADTVGTRSWEDVAALSARVTSYFATPMQNWLWGWTADRWGGMELRLFPGVTALLLAAVSLVAGKPRRLVWVYAATSVLAADLSLGPGSRLYVWLFDHIWALHALRAPSRLGIFAVGGLSVMAGFGFRAIDRLPGGSRPGRIALLGVLLALLMVEYESAPMLLTDLPSGTPDVYSALGARPSGVTLELPLPTLDRLPGPEALFMYWSTTHWYPLVNGYGGFSPVAYRLTLEVMRHFPNTDSIERLKRLKVRYVIVHRQFYEGRDYEKLLDLLVRRPDFHAVGRLRDWSDEATLFELN